MNVLLFDAWDTKPDKRTRRTFPTPDPKTLNAFLCRCRDRPTMPPQCDLSCSRCNGRYADVEARAEGASNAHDIAVTSCDDRPSWRATWGQCETAVWTCTTTSLASSAPSRK